MGNGFMTAKIINIRNTECPNCPEIQPVTDIAADLAFILVSTEVFARAINAGNYEMAMQVADQLIISGNKLGQYSIHKLHR